MKLSFTALAREDYLSWQGDRKALARINSLIRETMGEPFTGTGKPEPLKHALSGCWSRRIDREHRMVYKVEGETLTILQLRFHY